MCSARNLVAWTPVKAIVLSCDQEEERSAGSGFSRTGEVPESRKFDSLGCTTKGVVPKDTARLHSCTGRLILWSECELLTAPAHLLVQERCESYTTDTATSNKPESKRNTTYDAVSVNSDHKNDTSSELEQLFSNFETRRSIRPQSSWDSGESSSDESVDDYTENMNRQRRPSDVTREFAQGILQKGQQDREIMETYVSRDGPYEANLARNSLTASEHTKTSTVRERVVSSRRAAQYESDSDESMIDSLRRGSVESEELAAEVGDIPRLSVTPYDEADRVSEVEVATNPGLLEASCTEQPTEQATPSKSSDTLTSESQTTAQPPLAARRRSMSVFSEASLSLKQKREQFDERRARRSVLKTGVMFTDHARAGAVVLGEHDIKFSLRQKRFINRGSSLWIPVDCTFSAIESHARRELELGNAAYAVKLFTKGLDFETRDSSCLIGRSKGYNILGDHHAALRDAELALKIDARSARAWAQKAESLYSLGEFELALVSYHRGLKIRPDMQAFRVGVDKTVESLLNSIGVSARPLFSADVSDATMERMKLMMANSALPSPPATRQKSQFLARIALRDEIRQAPVASSGDELVRQVKNRILQVRSSAAGLQELEMDRLFMHKLMHYPRLSGKSKEVISRAAAEGIDFLDSREKFWIKQNPVYNRRVQPTTADNSKQSRPPPPTKDRPTVA